MKRSILDPNYIFLISTIHLILIKFTLSLSPLTLSFYFSLFLCLLLASPSFSLFLYIIYLSIYLSPLPFSCQIFVTKTKWSYADSTMIIMMQISHEKYDETNFIKCRDYNGREDLNPLSLFFSIIHIQNTL